MAKRRRSKKTNFTQKLLSYSVLFLLFIVLSIWVYSNRLAIAYYLSFKTNKTHQIEKIDQARIVQLLDKHAYKVAGIDVSEYQGIIDWKSVDSVGNKPIGFVLVRATAGKNKLDKKFNTNWEALKKKSIIYGAYHYYRPDEKAIEQAQFFTKHVQLTKGHLPPVLDIENLPKKQSMEQLKKGLKIWLNHVENHYGVKPIIYSGQSYYQDFLKEEFSQYTLWIANYNHWINHFPEDAAFWQFTEKGQVKGIKGFVDVNIFNGTDRMLFYKTIQ